VHVAHDGAAVRADEIYIAPGDSHLTVERREGAVRIALRGEPAPSGCRPSADPMIESVAQIYGAAAIAVVLSGMGRDGLLGCRRLVERGGAVLAQDRASSSVWGMPGSIAGAGLACAILPPAGLAGRLRERLAAQAWT
jgi:two-component system chemotaxis response regulator CheB